jgi:hypothetical protein
MTKTGSTSTSPDVVLANANTLTPPTRLRLDSRDSSTGSMHRRQSGGSFEFFACGLSEVLPVPVYLHEGAGANATPTLVRNISSGSLSGTPGFPTTIEYRAAYTISPLPVMSPNLVRGTSWSSCWTDDEPELDQSGDTMDDEESLWISEDEDEEHGNGVDANAIRANASVSDPRPPTNGDEMERKRSLGYISPAEGDSSSSSSSLSSSSSSKKGGQEKEKENKQQESEHQLQEVAPPNDWMLQWAQQGSTAPETTTSATPFTRVESPAMVIDEDIVTQEADITVDTGPIYLPVPDEQHKTEVESASNNKVILSGWVAVSADDSLLIKLAASDGRPTLVRSDLALLELTCDSLILRRGTNQAVTVIPLSNDCQVSAREISSRAGKCVVISKSSNTVCTILPVSLPRQFFAATGDELVEKDRFDRLQSCMFTPFVVETTPTRSPLSKPAPACHRTATCDLMWGQEYCVRHYAPNEQHDMARHLQFAIDSAIRMS